MLHERFNFIMPTTNHAYRSTRGKHRSFIYKTKETKELENIISERFRHLATDPLPKTVGLYVCTYLQSDRRDINSSTKMIQDATCRGLQINDKRIVLLVEEKIIDKTMPEHFEVAIGHPEEILNLLYTRHPKNH